MFDKIKDFNIGGLYLIDELLDKYHLDKNAKVLDIGCGSGGAVDFLSKKGLNAIGIDISQDIINEGKSKYGDINLVVMDAHSMDFEKNYFDIISIECSLSIMDNPKLVLNSCRDILKDNGIILLGDFFFKENTDKSNAYTLDYWYKLCEDMGFKVVDFKDQSKNWRNYIGKVLWEYGSLEILLGGCNSCDLNKTMLSRKTGYFLITLVKG
ncbi:class I SAM-dependent methyltransferase [Intestinibacter sp.]|uniref:class I SAM-dependent methyltransferase n=1 Tax=Intestinibacter sp. TaxID=1965304 RepID=UPI002A75819E|nr:class I SAM-dependent methyltransferase [Intestinibacter sp.]MDY2736650.1 class I SAM-dependent methyltransferase [Intestinibacter sp.]